MARYRGPVKKLKKRFGLLPESTVDHKQQRSRRKSDYGVRLEEKQRLKFVYGVLEKQFRRYVEEGMKSQLDTGEVFLRILESRLDNVVYRLGFAATRRQARQYVAHGHVLVDGKKIDIPSYRVKQDQTISLDKDMLENGFVQESLKRSKPEDVPMWLIRKGPVGKVKHLVKKEELRDDVNTNLVVEFYSR